ncbi:MAG: hypothetical protein U0587_02740 [Candidatus Binatia bacterium]
MANKVRIGDRSNLRITDLKARRPTNTRLMNVKIPRHIWGAIETMAGTLDTSKTAVVIALLEAGLEEMDHIKKK